MPHPLNNMKYSERWEDEPRSTVKALYPAGLDVRNHALEQQCQKYRAEAARADDLERRLGAREEECELLQCHASQATQSSGIHPVSGKLVENVRRGKGKRHSRLSDRWGHFWKSSKCISELSLVAPDSRPC